MIHLLTYFCSPPLVWSCLVSSCLHRFNSRRHDWRAGLAGRRNHAPRLCKHVFLSFPLDLYSLLLVFLIHFFCFDLCFDTSQRITSKISNATTQALPLRVCDTNLVLSRIYTASFLTTMEREVRFCVGVWVWVCLVALKTLFFLLPLHPRKRSFVRRVVERGYWLYPFTCVALRCVVLCCVVLGCVVLCCVVLCCVVLWCVALRCVALCCVVLRCVVLCCVVLCCVVLCCVALRCVVLCCVVLRCVVYFLVLS
jgi:hypothetical protein